MTYDLSNDLHRKQFLARSENLLDKGAVVELREMTGRSVGQNRYLHLILGVVAMDTGNTLAFTKEVYYKKLVNPDIFCVMKEDRIMGKVPVLRSSRDLTVEEMTESITRFKNWAAENGIYIPEPEDAERLKDIEMEMGRMKSYL
jgi:hypothetical protein